MVEADFFSKLEQVIISQSRNLFQPKIFHESDILLLFAEKLFSRMMY